MSNVSIAERPAPPATDPVTALPLSTRLVSLDVFRGVTVAGMLLVNNPGTWSHIYDPLQHAKWHGWTPTDLIFPFFLFIVGVSLSFSFAGQLARGASRGSLFAKAAKRSAILFLLGLILAAFPFYDLNLSTLRIPGVLQRIGLAFFLAAAVVLFTSLRGQMVTAAVLLLGYWAAMMLVSVPGFGAGDLRPEANLAAYLDRAILGTNHLWKSAKTWDPEGLFSTLPAVATVLLGVFTGRWIRSERSAAERTVGLFIAGNVGLVLGLVWHAVFPINKNIWTSSYVIFTAGMALHFLALCYWIVDVQGYRRWAHPFYVFGVNAIAAFFLSGIMARILNLVKWTGPGGDTVTLKGRLYQTLFASWLTPINASLAFALVFVAFWVAIMEIFHRKRIYVKV